MVHLFCSVIGCFCFTLHVIILRHTAEREVKMIDVDDNYELINVQRTILIEDCPSLLCEELEDLSKNSNRGNMSRRRRRETEEEVFSQWEDEEAAEETWREEKDGEGGKEEKVVTEGEEEEQVKPESRLKVVQEVQMEDDKIEKAKETIADEQESKVTKRLAQKDEQKKSKNKRGRKQSEQVRSKGGVKDVGERSEEEKTSETQEVPAMSSEETSALTNSCDLSDPLYLGFVGTGLCCPQFPSPAVLLTASCLHPAHMSSATE
ncbi:neurofilament medium polypeptide-like [Oreochromis niloticus]|uniref:neurofilament medium polypeptide-like n=1 Tax=Oreochromis niloticus TaxID=8128 RepID=UPI000DF36BE3|nr:neurofilament medium polypeptide-like [Oreochromis niloticus]